MKLSNGQSAWLIIIDKKNLDYVKRDVSYSPWLAGFVSKVGEYNTLSGQEMRIIDNKAKRHAENICIYDKSIQISVSRLSTDDRIIIMQHHQR